MIRSAKALLVFLSLSGVCFAQTAANAPVTDKADAYYHFAMGRMYAELAGSDGSANDYVSKAIENYQAAMKLDPSAGIIFEELTDVYIQSGRLRDAVTEAEDLLKENPDNLDARRMLGRIYTRMIGDAQQGRVSTQMVQRAIEQYQTITQKAPGDVDSWVILGRLYRIQNNSVEAEKAYNQALKADPKNEDALTALAMMYLDLGDTKRAIENLKAASEGNPSPQTLTALAAAYEQMRDYKSAVDALRRALAISPDNDRLVRGLVEDLKSSRQYDEALQIYQSMLSDDPRDGSAWLGMSEIYREKRDWAKAQEALDKAKAIDPENVEVQADEINLLEAQGKTNDAIAALTRLLDKTESARYTTPQARYRMGLLENLGMLYAKSGQYSKAVDAYRQIVGVYSDGGPEAEKEIINTYFLAKDLDNAKREADAAIKKYPDSPDLQVTHARLLANLGKVDEAASEVRTLAKGKEDLKTQLALAEIYEMGKRYSDVGKALDVAEKLATSEDAKQDVYYRRGAMYERMKKYDASEAEFRKVLALNPNNAEALNYLGYTLADRGVRLDEAAQLIKKALEIEPQTGAYLDSLGWVYYRQNNLQEAQNLLEEALADPRMGNDGTVHDHLGDVFFKQGKTKDAIAQWQASLKAFNGAAPTENDPEEVAKVGKKLESAKVRLAKETNRK